MSDVNNQVITAEKKPFIFKNRNFWIGVGVGAVTGATVSGFTAYSVTKKKERRRSREEIRAAREKMQRYIDENSIEVEISGDVTKENINKAVAEAVNQHLGGSEEEKSDDEEPSDIKSDDIYAEKGTLPAENVEKTVKNKEKSSDSTEKYPWTISGRQYHVQLKDGGILSYPIEIFCDNNGLMDVGKIRANLRIYEHNPKNLKRVWEALGWGYYDSLDDDGVPVDPDITSMDVSIDDLDEMEKTMGDDPEEATIARERYIDMVQKYKNAPHTGQPNIVTKRHFEDNRFLDQIYVNYYDVDNVFTNSTDLDSTIDQTTLFGVSDGNALFDYKKNHLSDFEDDDQDPDIVYVENFADNTIAEITRYHVSYESVRNGGAYFDGGSGEVGGT